MADDVTFCVVPIPGPAGPPGEDGTDGVDGLNAYTTSTASFVMPAEGANVTFNVVASDWATVGQVVVVRAGGAFGHFSVAAKPTATSLTLTNLESTASSLYTSNSAPGTSFASGATISPAGLQGPQGSAAAAGAPLDATYITQTPNGTLTGEQALSGLATGLLKSTTGTGVLSIGVQGTDYYAPGGTDVAVADGGTGASTPAVARANLGVEIGLDVQAYDPALDSFSLLPTVADRIAYSTALNVWAETPLTSYMRTLLDDVDAATARTTLGISASAITAMLLFRHQEANNIPGGAFSNGSWQLVPLNTEVVDTGNNGSIAANQVTLAAGTYRYRFGVVGFAVGNMQGRLFNVTDAGVIANTYGTVITAIGAPDGNALATGVGRFTIATSKVIQLEAQCTTTNAGDGFGSPGNFAGGEVYSFLELEKEP